MDEKVRLCEPQGNRCCHAKVCETNKDRPAGTRGQGGKNQCQDNRQAETPRTQTQSSVWTSARRAQKQDPCSPSEKTSNEADHNMMERMAPNASKLSDRGWRKRAWDAIKTPPLASVRWSAWLGRAAGWWVKTLESSSEAVELNGIHVELRSLVNECPQVVHRSGGKLGHRRRKHDATMHTAGDIVAEGCLAGDCRRRQRSQK